MRFSDSVTVFKRTLDGEQKSFVLSGVCLTETNAIATEKGGYKNAGEAILRIPGEEVPDISCGDFICRLGSETRYVVSTVRDNRKKGSGIAHWKIICRG